MISSGNNSKSTAHPSPGNNDKKFININYSSLSKIIYPDRQGIKKTQKPFIGKKPVAS